MRLNAFGLLAAALVVLLASAAPAFAQVTIFHDRTSFTAALAGLGPVGQDDFESYPLGDIPQAGVRGDFRYSFDPSLTQPAIVAGGNGGQALGGSPFGVFVGGDALTLSAGPGSALRAFGADLLYAPSFDTIPADTYRLQIANGAAAGRFAGSLDSIDPSGGTFFLGVLADPGFAFSAVTLFSVQPAPDFLVPAYQADNLIYAGAVVPASPVPEPGAAALCVGALWGLLPLARARRRE